MSDVSHRGVWCVSPGTGAQRVLIVFDRNNNVVLTPVVIPRASSESDIEDIAQELWRVLNADDPGPAISGSLPPSFRRMERRVRDRSDHLKAI